MEDIGILAALIAGVWALLLWLSIIVWVYRDIRERTRAVLRRGAGSHDDHVVVVLGFAHPDLPRHGRRPLRRPPWSRAGTARTRAQHWSRSTRTTTGASYRLGFKSCQARTTPSSDNRGGGHEQHRRVEQPLERQPGAVGTDGRRDRMSAT